MKTEHACVVRPVACVRCWVGCRIVRGAGAGLRWQLALWMLAVLWLPWASESVADEQQAARLQTGRALSQLLQSEGSLTVNPASVGNIVSGIQAGTGIPLVLDRRVDPATKVTMSAQQTSFESILRQVAENVPEAGASFTDRLVFIGPESAAKRLESLLDDNRRQISGLRDQFSSVRYRRLTRAKLAGWPRLAEPRRLVMQAAEEAGLEISNPDTIPHDVWAEKELPQLDFCDYSTLILNQFELTFRVLESGDVIEIVPVVADSEPVDDPQQ